MAEEKKKKWRKATVASDKEKPIEVSEDKDVGKVDKPPKRKSAMDRMKKLYGAGPKKKD